MTSLIEAAAISIDAVADFAVNGWAGEQTFVEAWGLGCPPITRHELSKAVASVASTIRNLSGVAIDDEAKKFLGNLPVRTANLMQQVMPHMYNGNCAVASNSLRAFFVWIDDNLGRYYENNTDWTNIQNQKLLPKNLISRLRSVDLQVISATERCQNLDHKIHVINEAYAAADSLPTDLQILREARDSISIRREEVEADRAKVAIMLESVSDELTMIKLRNSEAVKLVENCEDAYSAATTKGLGEAFSIREKELARSMWVWVFGLILSLTSAILLGHGRLANLQKALDMAQPNGMIILTNLLIAFLGIAAPVWFAWLSTKQIGQRFRLAEDYGFKASVAKAYEGYRREAARLDPDFAARLFGSALSRIEEAPLRFVEEANHGSPWQEAFSKIPGISSKWGAILPQGGSKVPITGSLEA